MGCILAKKCFDPACRRCFVLTTRDSSPYVAQHPLKSFQPFYFKRHLWTPEFFSCSWGNCSPRLLKLSLWPLWSLSQITYFSIHNTSYKALVYWAIDCWLKIWLSFYFWRAKPWKDVGEREGEQLFKIRIPRNGILRQMCLPNALYLKAAPWWSNWKFQFWSTGNGASGGCRADILRNGRNQLLLRCASAQARSTLMVDTVKMYLQIVWWF